MQAKAINNESCQAEYQFNFNTGMTTAQRYINDLSGLLIPDGESVDGFLPSCMNQSPTLGISAYYIDETNSRHDLAYGQLFNDCEYNGLSDKSCDILTILERINISLPQAKANDGYAGKLVLPSYNVNFDNVALFVQLNYVNPN